MYYAMNRKYPILEEGSESNPGRKWIICLSVISLSVCSATMIFVAYHYHLFGLGLYCPKKSLLFKVNSPNTERVLWDYATFWSNKAKNDRSITFFIDPSSPDQEPVVLNGLGDTFQSLSLHPCPSVCRKKSDRKALPRRLRKSKTPVPPFVNHGEPFGGLPLHPLFEVDLGNEFRFRDDVMSEATETLMDIMEKMANESFDQLVTIYLSTFTPDLEMKLSGNNSSNIKESQSAMMKSAMDSYRNASKPLFLVMGDQFEAAEFNGTDIVKEHDVPENVALAILSSSNDTIFNHGLWPAFGALLSRSNVTSYAMDKNLLDAAKNASLNWKASVTY